MIDALMNIVPIILKLESTVGITMHLAEVEFVHPEEWHKLANDLRQAAWDDDKPTTKAHKVAIAVARAEKEPPGSKADLERADALWTLLRSLVGADREQRTNAGYPPRSPPTLAGLDNPPNPTGR